MNNLNRIKQSQVFAALVEGNSVRATERMTGVAKHTILKLIKDVGIACADYQDRALRNLNCKPGWRMHRAFCDVCGQRARCHPSRESVHGQQRRILKVVEPEARPVPLVGRTDQAALHRVGVHVIQFFEALLFAPDVQVIKPPLPGAVSRGAVNGFGKGEHFQHPGTPEMIDVLAEVR